MNSEDILNICQANMFDELMHVLEILTTGITNEIELIENSWVRQSNLIHLLGSSLSSNEQKTAAANELARLNENFKKPDGYAEIGYWETNYSQ